MWRVDVVDRQREPLFYGWFATAADAGEFVENTLELFLLQQAKFYTVTDGDKRIEYTAGEAAECVFASRRHEQ